ncbi:MAG: DUF1330 domain-containing protein [Proteobacteria bacterium]|jgi:uncharacterized protein (DUF1330 family)|nr:DUF1330 domain-containing protein [Paracoccaceae bacterium]MDA0317935.1 DUF1330 domain-containing protein [Pseudomonadota bacterium]MDA0850113.1 DUF1330 domain-containing protein [Pseudomonadota bacterium]MDA1294208.1 DUF1330 domain-containing protein [Pseudomonadota bacterium]NCW16054.1 DUF1330 domain-containing protein [Paracoccaceae bacterium]
MPKAYWVAHVDVKDPAAYENYKAANAVAFAKYGAKFIVRGGKQEIREGQSRARTVVLEFQDYDTAMACYNSPEYQKALAIRKDISTGDLVIVEGM